MRKIKETITFEYWKDGSGWSHSEIYKEEIYPENEIDWNGEISDWWKLPDEITEADIENEDDVKITVVLSDASTGEILEVEEVWESELLADEYKRRK